MLKKLVLFPLLLSAAVVSAEFPGTYITEKPAVTLEKALPIALKAVQSEVVDLDNYILHSVTPRVLKADAKGIHWQFMWQELEYKTHIRGITVRVYMKDGSVSVERFKE